MLILPNPGSDYPRIFTGPTYPEERDYTGYRILGSMSEILEFGLPPGRNRVRASGLQGEEAVGQQSAEALMPPGLLGITRQ